MSGEARFPDGRGAVFPAGPRGPDGPVFPAGPDLTVPLVGRGDPVPGDDAGRVPVWTGGPVHVGDHVMVNGVEHVVTLVFPEKRAP